MLEEVEKHQLVLRDVRSCADNIYHEVSKHAHGRKPGRGARGASGDSSTGATFSDNKANPIRPPARAEKRMAPWLYQLKSGHALTGVYLKSTENRPNDHCWWCDPENISGTSQTREPPVQAPPRAYLLCICHMAVVSQVVPVHRSVSTT